jgi:IMP dehydrogenase/GMP reductase
MKFDKMFNHMAGISTETKMDFNDLLIQPAVTTDVVSRQEINPYVTNNLYVSGIFNGKQYGRLPLFAAPMDTVVSLYNSHDFIKNKINVCLPRGEKLWSNTHCVIASVSLDDFIKEYNTKGGLVYNAFVNGWSDLNTLYILIDVANGHMKKMENAIIDAKKIYGSRIFIMAGNVAHPGAYENLSNAGADAIRIGIGNGNGCLTSEQTGVGYPIASLIRECYYKSLTMHNPALIIADGGMKSYSDIIKAIALGADFVMVGSILNKALESAGPTYLFKKIKVNPNGKFAKWLLKKGFTLTKKFRGMSTKEVQKDWGKDNIKTSEGVIRYRPVEYTLPQWTENFESYLRSAMSYTNKKTLKEFRGEVDMNLISENSYKRFNK